MGRAEFSQMGYAKDDVVCEKIVIGPRCVLPTQARSHELNQGPMNSIKVVNAAIAVGGRRGRYLFLLLLHKRLPSRRRRSRRTGTTRVRARVRGWRRVRGRLHRPTVLVISVITEARLAFFEDHALPAASVRVCGLEIAWFRRGPTPLLCFAAHL